MIITHFMNFLNSQAAKIVKGNTIIQKYCSFTILMAVLKIVTI